ncbi:MAG: flagellar hook-basal body complex protein FliE [Pseudomonadota bacterium]
MIDNSRIEAMVSQLKAAAARAQGLENPIQPQTQAVGKADFATALKSSLDGVNNSHLKSEQLGQSFAMGDDKVSLSDVMVSMQKANIEFQATVQVRNKLVSAYHEIMNMQV